MQLWRHGRHVAKPDGQFAKAAHVVAAYQGCIPGLNPACPPRPPLRPQILLLENVRFYPEEEKNDAEFAKKLAAPADM